MGKRGVVGLVLVVLVGLPAVGLAETPAERRLRVLEEQLRKTQEEVQQLKRELNQQKAIGQATQKQAESAEQQATAVQTATKGFELPEWVKKFSLFGDLRIRHEGFYHQPAKKGTLVTARNRERFRARVGLKFTYSDELSATIRLASGNPDDPISTNETFSGDFTGKRVRFDWAFITFTPGKTFGLRPGVLAINAGKQPNPIFRVGEMVFDDDLAPEGFSETVQVLGAPVGALDQVKIHALQGSFNEVSNGQDGWLFGGQVNPQMHIGTTQIEAGVGQFGYLNVNQIATALNTNRTLANTNLIDRDADGNVTNYQSAFLLSDAVLAITFPNVVGTQPVRVFGEYVYNWDAATDASHGAMGGVKLGQTKTQGDWAVTAFYEHVEQDAVLSAFSYSDFGVGGTNQEGPVVALEYQLLNPLTLTVKNHFTNYIDRPADTRNPTLFRLQLDALVKF